MPSLIGISIFNINLIERFHPNTLSRDLIVCPSFIVLRVEEDKAI